MPYVAPGCPLPPPHPSPPANPTRAARTRPVGHRQVANTKDRPPGRLGGKHYAVRFYGATENRREVDMDMREMVAKVKAGEPLYGESKLSPYLQGVAARQSRYSALFFSAVPWFNFVNHGQHGVDTAKYYQQAERELEAERTGKSL